MLEFLRTKEITIKSALITLTAAVVVLFAPLFFFGKISLDGDTVMYTYPAAYLLQAYMDTSLNLLSFGGYPITAAFHIGYFSPVYRLFLSLFDFITAYHLIIFIDYLAAVLLTFAFIRSLGRSAQASLLGASVFVFSQWGIYWMSSINISHTMYLLPAMLLSVLKISEGRWRYGLLIPILIGLNLTYTHYQFILMALIFSGSFMLYLAWKLRTRKMFVGKCLGVFALACALGFVLGAPQLLRTIEFLPLTLRSVFSAELSVWYFDLLRFLVPSFEIPKSTQEFMPYIGIVPLFLVGVALLRMRKEAWHYHGRFFAWTAVIVIILAMKYSPFFYMLKSVPFIGHYFLQPSRFLYLGVFSCGVVAAFGLDYLIAHPQAVGDRFKKNFKRITWIITGVTVFGNLSYFMLRDHLLSFAKNYFDIHKYSQTVGLPHEYYHGLIEVMADKMFLNVSLLNPGIFFGIVSLFGIRYLIKINSEKNYFANMAVIFTVVNLLAVGMLGLHFGSHDLIREKPYFSNIIVEREKGKMDYRVFSYLVPFAQYQEIMALNPEKRKEGFVFMREALMGNFHFYSSIPIVGGYEPLAPRRYQSMLYYLESVPADLSEKGKNEDAARKINHLSMMNGKYLISPYPLVHEKLKLLEKTDVTTFKKPLYLYQNVDVLPMEYKTKKVTYLKEGNIDENFKTVAAFTGSFKETTFIECNDCSETDSWHVVQKTFVPGWKATVNGKEEKIYYANHSFQAVKVPKGEYSVSFSYSPVI